MNILELSQIIFNFTASTVVIFFGILLVIIALGTAKIIKNLKNLIRDLNKESAELYKKIDGLLNNLSNLSFISKFFNKKRSKK